MPTDWRRDQLAAAERGEHPLVLAKMRSGYAVLGLNQFLPGYCLLFASPKAGTLTELDIRQRNEFLLDMSLLGEAIEKACNPRRVNYSILGNADPLLHAHVFPRYEWEADQYKNGPVWKYPDSIFADGKNDYSESSHGELKQRISYELEMLMKMSYN